MSGMKFGTVSGGFLMAGVSGYLAREIWFDMEEDFLLRAPVTEEGYILPENYVKVYENDGSWLVLDLENGEDEPFRLRSTDVFGWRAGKPPRWAGKPPRWGTWRIYRGGKKGLWITFEEHEEGGSRDDRDSQGLRQLYNRVRGAFRDDPAFAGSL